MVILSHQVRYDDDWRSKVNVRAGIEMKETDFNPNGLPALSSVKQACAFLNIGPSKFYDLVRTGRLKTIKLGKRSTRVTRAELERFLREIEESL